MKVPMLDLAAQHAVVGVDVRAAVQRVLESQSFILGPEVAALELELTEYLGVEHAVGVSSGTDALLMALMALEVGPGDEVITTPFSFFATAGCIARVGARPVFVDIESDTFNIDATQIESAMSNRTRAIIPVHLFGQCADMDAICDLANPRGVAVIEDAAQALGATYKGRRAGSLGHIGCFSFYPTKNLGGVGDGGLVTTNDEELAEKLRVLRVHGAKPKYHHQIVGGNFRLDAIQAAVLRAKLPHLDAWHAARNTHAARYDIMLADTTCVTPTVRDDRVSVFNQYTVRIPAGRDDVQRTLRESGVSSIVYYPVPLSAQRCFAYLNHEAGDYPQAELAAQSVLSLPVYPELTEQQQRHVVEMLAAATSRSE